MSQRGELRLKRVYEPASPDDGFRVFVERLWPRGLTKADVAADLWLRDVAPSKELREWYGHDRARWPEFRRRYRAELEGHAEALARLRAELERGPVTLLFAARDPEHSSAAVLREFLEGNG
ncbi:MAG: DUF488 domain-containing protein [Gemmatimonadetes bacterium]|nr:DUF488 domain-containing protein [Gemmatimonadota bacterium]